MSKTYQATGIILKGMPLGEADRLVTILTTEFGLIRAVAPGARKYKSSLRGRSEIFVVNQFSLARGRSLDKITQAETIESYSGLSRDLGKLAAGQYLAELVLCCALSEQPQTELYELLNEHLRRLASLSSPEPTLHACLAQAVFHLLAVGGICPQVHACCLTRTALTADFVDPRWRVGFSFEAGGAIDLTRKENPNGTSKSPDGETSQPILPPINTKLGAVEISLLQHLGGQFLPQAADILPPPLLDTSLTGAWARVEGLLRDYAQYHYGRAFRAADLVDSFSPLDF
jgi:DNA repair protein RecO (recombination protein O)